MEETVNEVFETVARSAPEISAGMLDRRDYVDEDNPSGEEQLAADVWANRVLKDRITSIDGVGEFASEEEEGVTDCGDGVGVTIDPLDGSSNIPSNNLVGIIVGIYDGELPCKGRNLAGSFYVVFGPLTTVVLAKEGSVEEYVVERTNDQQVEIHQTKENIELPDPYVYGFGGRRPEWTPGFRKFATEIEEELKLRYGGAMVGDVNQVLNYGGIFSYPALRERPEGKLRLVFEGNPMAYVFENAGGSSSDGERNLLDVEADELHQRTPVHLGNDELIERLEELV
ncbi:MAG: class 1 fructose-bisphosphatase [Halobacteria archaeon]|nr:class 1 fructose-bisphosphatase [Halobacteria archaeon]